MTLILPSYDELPVLGALGVRHSWEVLPHDQGTLSFIGEEQIRYGAATVTKGRSYSLSEPFDTFAQPLFGRDAIRHDIVEAGRNEVEDVLHGFNPQAYSQIDGLAHVRAREHGFYGGYTDLDEARDRLGMHHWAARTIVGRGVLVDVHGYRLAHDGDDDPMRGSPITVDELELVLDEQGVTLRRGDILLIRTGWLETFRKSPNISVTAWNGLYAGEETARFLWNHKIAIVGTDNPAVEDAPGSRDAGSLHRRLLPSLGLSLMELLRLDELAAACTEANRWEFFFTAAPLPVQGAVSSPANALAVV